MGFYGLVGSGKTELARAIFGADRYAGQIEFADRKLGQTPVKTIEAGIAFVPEERRTQGLFTLLTIRRNIPVMNMKISRAAYQRGKEKAAARNTRQIGYQDRYHGKGDRKSLGGNQQKWCSPNAVRGASCCCSMNPARCRRGAKSEKYQSFGSWHRRQIHCVFSYRAARNTDSCDRSSCCMRARYERNWKTGRK